MAKPAVPPTAEEALRRVDEMTIALLWEVRRLLETRAVMETANQVILEKGIILGVHRLMSSAFVAVNILGNSLATIVIAGWEGAVDRTALKAGLDAGPA